MPADSSPRPGITAVLWYGTSVTRPPLFLTLGDDVFEELVHRPRDGRGGHLIDDSGLNSSEIGRDAAYLINRPKGVSHAGDMSAHVGGIQGKRLLRVQ